MFLVMSFFASATILEGCDLFKTCDECSLHYADRNCGWCEKSKQCMADEGNETDCPQDMWYYHGNAKCGEEIPLPPEPWPRYEANATFCYSMTGEYCKKCVSTNTSMKCGWCHDTKECIMGDENGPYFAPTKCEKWSYEVDDKCIGKISKKAIVAIRVVIAIFITVVTALSMLGCYKVIKKPKTLDSGYEQVD